MANLLPQHYVRSLKRERIVRIATVSCMAAAGVVIIVGVSLLPSYFIARSNEANTSSEIEVLRQVLEKREKGDAASEARQLRAELGAIQEYMADQSAITLIAEVLSDIPDDIDVVNLTLREDTVKVDGIAGSRSSLLEYQKRIGQNDLFELPPIDVSTLALQFDVTFSLLIPITTAQQEAAAAEAATPDRDIQGT